MATPRKKAAREKARRKQAPVQRGSRGRFAPGVSGNPAGRPPGSGEVAQLRAGIAAHLPQIIDALVEKATDGDAAAARLLLERVIAPLKAAEQAVQIALPDGSFTDQGRAILTAAGLGTLTPGQAAQLLTGIGSLARTAEIDELAARVAALEQGVNDASK